MAQLLMASYSLGGLRWQEQTIISNLWLAVNEDLCSTPRELEYDLGIAPSSVLMILTANLFQNYSRITRKTFASKLLCVIWKLSLLMKIVQAMSRENAFLLWRSFALWVCSRMSDDQYAVIKNSLSFLQAVIGVFRTITRQHMHRTSSNNIK